MTNITPLQAALKQGGVMITDEIRDYLQQCAPHVLKREAAQLLQRALDELEGRDEEIAEFYRVMQGFVDAYPASVFPEISSEDYKKVHEVLSREFSEGMGSRLHGAWGRHISMQIKNALPTPPKGEE